MPARVLIAKPGLDGHDRGAKLIARALRDAGFEVVYLGIRQRPETIAAVAVQEDVAMIGLSILSGAHLGLIRRTMDELRLLGADDIPVVVGGTIPSADAEQLRALGVAEVFSTGTDLADAVERVRRLTGSARSA